VFFKHGPFAWNGVLAWWIPLTMFFIWFVVMTVLLLRAIADDERQQKHAGTPDRLPGSRSDLAKPTVS